MITNTHRAGFTFVELLVVVLIVVLSIALVLPALAQGGDAAKSAQCLANLQQTIAANASYAADYGNVYIIFQELGDTQAIPRTGGWFWFTGLTAYGYLPVGHQEMDSALMCPSGEPVDFVSAVGNPWDTVSPSIGNGLDDPRTDPRLGYYFSDVRPIEGQDVEFRTNYAASATFQGFSEYFEWDKTVPIPMYFPMQNDHSWLAPGNPPSDRFPIDQMYKPEQTTVFWDGMWSFALGGAWRHPFTRIHLRHDGGNAANFSFVDGHAASIPKEKIFEPYSIREPQAASEEYFGTPDDAGPIGNTAGLWDVKFIARKPPQVQD